MTYKPTAFKEKVLPKVGTQIKGIVTNVEEGKLSDFVEADSLAKWQKANPEDDCIQISCTTEDGLIRKRVIQLPTELEVHPKSNLANWKNKYGGYPALDQEIYLIADAEGWFQFA